MLVRVGIRADLFIQWEGCGAGPTVFSGPADRTRSPSENEGYWAFDLAGRPH